MYFRSDAAQPPWFAEPSTAMSRQEKEQPLPPMSADEADSMERYLWAMPMCTQVEQTAGMTIPGDGNGQENAALNNGMLAAVSVGSIGHPHSCAEACKYQSKPRGCKDGASCDRCHLCEWKATRTRRARTHITPKQTNVRYQ
jgi:hypothetical protein